MKINRFLYFSFSFQVENRALRLRETATAASAGAQYLDELAPSTSPAQQNVPSAVLASATDNRLSWDYFDELGYIQRGGLRTGEDPYVRNRFNQQASDLLPSNRNIPDTRNPM